MGINAFKIKKWFKMMTGQSLFHAEQGLGKFFVPDDIKGYYNDLTSKVLLDQETLKKEELPKTQNEKGKNIVFATTIFQYGLGCFDLFLETKDHIYYNQFQKCVEWAIENQDENGGWNISCYAGKESPYGAMAQGEGTSLLLRAYALLNKKCYLECARKAMDLMLTPIDAGGTSRYDNSNQLFLLEFMNLPCILNGWIFALFGLYDFCIVVNEKKYKEKLEQTISTLKNHICDYDKHYWSKYDEERMIASPFYHKLHIAQLKALMMIDESEVWKIYLDKFVAYQNSFWRRKKAFIVKAFQKIAEK